MTDLTYLTARFSRAAIAGALAFAIPLTAVAPLFPAAAQTTDADLDQVVGALRAIGTMTADFTQTDRKGQTVRGVLTLKRPGKIRFEYEKSAKMLVVSNGKSLYLIDYEVNQVQRWPIGNSPLGALLDPNRDVKKFGKLIPSGTDNVVNRCSIERGLASWVYPNSEVHAQYEQCTDLHSGSAIAVP